MSWHRSFTPPVVSQASSSSGKRKAYTGAPVIVQLRFEPPLPPRTVGLTVPMTASCLPQHPSTSHKFQRACTCQRVCIDFDQANLCTTTSNATKLAFCAVVEGEENRRSSFVSPRHNQQTMGPRFLPLLSSGRQRYSRTHFPLHNQQ